MARTQQLCRSAVAALSSLTHNASSIAIILLVLLSVGTLPAAAGTWNAFGPKLYTRGSGAPVTVTDTFSIKNPNTTYTLHLVNGSLVDSQYESVGQTIVTINGVAVVGQQYQFTQNTTTLDVPVTLQLNNEIDVQIRGQVGGAMSAQIIGVDNDLPTISAAVSPAPNSAGWERTAATVTFTCDDATSGVATCPAPVTVGTETAGQSVSGTATDLAGNTNTASVTVKLDLTPPAVQPTLTPAPNGVGWNNGDVTSRIRARMRFQVLPRARVPPA